MAAHVASQIIAAVGSRLASVADVYYVPLAAVPIDNLPAIIVQDIDDETAQALGKGPVQEQHRLSFELFGVVAHAESGFQTEAGELRASIELALMAAADDISLDGLCKPGLRRIGAEFRVDAESLQKPVGGWAMKFNCVYSLKTDAPDTAI